MPISNRALALAIATLASCSSGVPTASNERNLVAASPDRSRDQSGALVAAPSTGFRPNDVQGWGRFSVEIDGAPAVWTVATRAVLNLPAVDARDRTIDIEVVGRATEEPLRVELLLNGYRLGSQVIDALPTHVELDAPEGTWRVGDNLLEIVPSTTVALANDPVLGNLGRRAIAVRRVAYGRAVGTRVVDAGLSLSPGTAAVYAVEGVGDIELTGACAAELAGDLVLSALRFDPIAGEFVPTGSSKVVALRPGGSARFDATLITSGAGPHAVGVEWRAEEREGAELLVTEFAARRAATHTRAPVIFISIDTLSASQLGLYGYDRDTSPNLAALAEDAVVFTNCRANAPWTVPSYLSQFTGLLPLASRVRADGDEALAPWDQRTLDRSRWSLPELMRAAGFLTVGIVDNPWLRNIRGMRRGFEHWDAEPAGIPKTDPSGGARLVFERALEQLDAAAERTPFLFLQVVDVHGPYSPSGGFAGRFGSTQVASDDVLVPVVKPDVFVAHAVDQLIASSLGPDAASAPEISGRRLVAAYDEGVSEIDALVGEFLRALESRGRYDEALIIVSADHGESLLADDFLFTHLLPSEQVLRVPLIIKLPGTRGGGRRVDTDVQLIDLYPTIAEFAGVDVTGRLLHGHSLAPLLEGRDGTADERDMVAFDGEFEASAIVRGRWKLVEYDLTQADPPALLTYTPARRAWAAFDDRLKMLDEVEDLRVDRIARMWAPEKGELLAENPWAESVASSLQRFTATRPVLRQLHDLSAGVRESEDVAGAHPEVVKELAGALAQLRAAAEPLRVVRGSSGATSTPMDAELLRDLGYLDRR